ncbi:MAG TPA: response regulator [Opitutaceae bacterium]|jgi:CheY-like chemotaxis protein
MTIIRPRPRTLLLVEDNEDDLFFMRRAIAAAGVDLPLHVAETGQVAIDYLSGVNGYADRDKHPMPFLVFLDLKLPQKSGLEVLAYVRSRPELRALLVLILTSSREESDVQKAYTLGANSFLVKPPNGSQLNELMKLVRAYWLDNPQLALP